MKTSNVCKVRNPSRPFKTVLHTNKQFLNVEEYHGNCPLANLPSNLKAKASSHQRLYLGPKQKRASGALIAPQLLQGPCSSSMEIAR